MTHSNGGRKIKACYLQSHLSQEISLQFLNGPGLSPIICRKYGLLGLAALWVILKAQKPFPNRLSNRFSTRTNQTEVKTVFYRSQPFANGNDWSLSFSAATATDPVDANPTHPVNVTDCVEPYPITFTTAAAYWFYGCHAPGPPCSPSPSAATATDPVDANPTHPVNVTDCVEPYPITFTTAAAYWFYGCHAPVPPSATAAPLLIGTSPGLPLAAGLQSNHGANNSSLSHPNTPTPGSAAFPSSSEYSGGPNVHLPITPSSTNVFASVIGGALLGVYSCLSPSHFTPCPLTTTIPPTLYRRAFSASPASPASLAFTFAFALRPPPPLFPAPTPRPPPFRRLFPSDHVLPSLPSLSLFFLHLIRLLILVPSLPYTRRARQHLISLSPPTTHYPPPAASKTIWSLDTLGSLVLSYTMGS
ncbi:hypothetical protein C8J57DRAFT_1511727 [Mycena rebaudengoi]|nr:hypothetical protein C8J57DRAFT_1511727 [Mycena rebaudengoi]